MGGIMNASEAMDNAVIAQLGDRYRENEPCKEKMNDSDKNAVIAAITYSFVSGELGFKKSDKYDTEEKIAKYAKALLKNNLAKSKKLNGGTKYEAKNPGSRTDEVLSNLKIALTQVAGDPAKVKAVADAIKQRESEIAAERTTKTAKPLDVSKLPAEIAALL
jgi:hypothetical protein